MIDQHRKWLEEDVVYLISPTEKAIFTALGTTEERDRFILQFWQRVGLDVKEEHYKRISTANKRFGWRGRGAAVAGWKSDRGKMYILYGPPDEIDSHKVGVGATARSGPFEIWRYSHINRVGDNVELMFSDPNGDGEYRLASTPPERR